jgi:peptidoglycan/LPS O-acetylase OafA/YrhL
MKHRFETIDGMRGIAALAVFGSHLQLARNQGGWFSQGALAVDFFFLLSGFVIGAAYERRLAAGLPLASYARIRLARLYPMIVAGALLGLAVAMLNPTRFNPWVVLPFQLAFVPFFLVAGGDVPMYPLNPVQWSLFFELFVNAAHAVARSALTTSRLIAVTLLSAVGSAFAIAHFGTDGVGFDRASFWAGFPRVVFSFSAGLLTFRLHSAGALPRIRVPYLLTIALLALVLALPKPPHVSDMVYVGLAFPALLIAALSADAPDALRPLAVWAGAVSYPLYAIHGPLLSLFVAFIPLQHAQSIRAIGWATSIPVTIAAAWLFERYFDAPIRLWLEPAAKRAAPGVALAPKA